MKYLLAYSVAMVLWLPLLACAADTTPPTLTIQDTWCEKEGVRTHFKMLLDPRDETGFAPFQAIEFRSVLGSTTPISDTVPWNAVRYPWVRGVPFDIPFTCTAVVFELRAVDAAGNRSALQRRTFKTPFPYSLGPNQVPQLSTGAMHFYGAAPSACRGLFAGKINDSNNKDDLLSIDRTTGDVCVLQTNAVIGYGAYVALNLGANVVEDSAMADFDGDGRLDIAVVMNGALGVYHNDGPDTEDKVHFSPASASYQGTLITTVQHLTTGDITGEGKADIIVTGTDANGEMRVGWLINDGTFSLTASNGRPAVSTTGGGRIAAADMNGDGRADLVAVDTANNQLVIYTNKGSGQGLAGSDETDPAYQPKTILTGIFSAGPNTPGELHPADAFTIGDVTGDGKPDVVIMMRALLFTNPLDSNDGRTQQVWRLYENRGPGGFQQFPAQLVGQSPVSETVTQVFPSDVLLKDLNQDNLPELIFTDYFNNNLQVVRLTAQLDINNQMTDFEIKKQSFTPYGDPFNGHGSHTGPARLVSGDEYGGTAGSLGSIGAVFEGSDSMLWIDNVSDPSSTPLDVIGASYTDSDADGTTDSKGLKTYFAFLGEKVSSSITVINNTENDLTGVFADCSLPSTVSIDTDATDPDWSPVTIGGVKYIRWGPLHVLPYSAVARSFRTRINSGAPGSTIVSNCYFRQGSGNTVLASAPMPTVKLSEPVDVSLKAVTDSDNSGGDTAHAEEKIDYTVTVHNRGEAPLLGCKATMAVPASTTFFTELGGSALNAVSSATTALGVFSSDGQPDIRYNWESFHAYTTGRLMVDASGRLHQCTTAGTSGASQPVWATGNNKTTVDGAVTWTCKGQITAISWLDFDLPASSTANIPFTVKIYPNIGLGDTAAAKPKIICPGTTLTRPGPVKITGNSVVTELQPQLALDLSTDKIATRPGEQVTCVITVHNYGTKAVTNAKAVYKLPEGVTIENVYTPDHADAPDGQGNFDADPLPFSQLYTVPNPVYDPATRVLSWALGMVPQNAARRLKFVLQVQYDLAGHCYTGGQYNPVEVVNGSYNFAATSTAGKRLFAALPPSIPAATPVTAATSALLSTKVPARVLQISEDAPLTPPALRIRKSASGDGKVLTATGEIPTVINDTAVSTDGFFTYFLEWDNTIDLVNGPVPGTVRQAAIRDYIPAGCNFAGFINMNFTAVSDSYLGYKFYDAAGKELKVTTHEAFTDTNGNGFYDIGEPYADTNRNKKFDGIAASAIRSISFPLGDVPGNQAGIFQYKVQASAADGAYIDSLPALLTKTGVLTWTLTAGYYTTASNLLFPVPSANVPVRVLVTKPAKITIPSGIITSRDEARGAEATEIGFIVDVGGALGVNVSDMKASLQIPAGMQVLAAQIFNQAGALVGNASSSSSNTALARTLDFALGTLRSATVKFKVALDPVNGVKLRNNTTVNGYTTAPLKIAPKITGSYKVAPPAAPAAASLRALAASVQAADPAPKALAATSALAFLPVMSNETVDANVFVGRVTPATVKRGGTFAYTIYIGNLSGDNGLNSGTISMKVPVGCTATGFRRHAFNSLQYNGAEISGDRIGVITPVPVDKNAVTAQRDGTWARPLAAGTTIKLDIFSLLVSEGGVMQILMKVDDTFKGNRIDDSSCTFDAVNVSGKSAGPVGVVVLDSNDVTDEASTVQLLMEGMGVTFTPAVRDAMAATLKLDAQSMVISGSGCQMLQLANGANVVQMPKNRVMVLGRSDRVTCDQPTRLPLDGAFRIAVGPGSASSGITMTKIPLQLASLAFDPNALLISASQANGIVAAGGGNIVAAGGGNIVAAGGGNLTANSGGVHFTPPEGGPPVYFLDADGKVLPQYGNGIVAAGGGNIVAAGGGNIVAAGGGNIVAAGGGNLIGQDASNLRSKDPLGIVAAGGGNIVAAGGGNIVAAGGGNIVVLTAGNIVAAGGGNLLGNDPASMTSANFK